MMVERSNIMKVAIETSSICIRRLLDLERIRQYLLKNGHVVCRKPFKAEIILFFGCAFNNNTEKESLEALKNLCMLGKHIVVLEGIADVLKLAAEENEFINAEIIEHREYEKLDQYFARSHKLSEIGQVNNLYSCQKRSRFFSRKKENKVFYVQIAHGCSDDCSYCGDKLIVKDLKSKPIELCLSEIREGINGGYRNIELIGDDVGAYGTEYGYTLIELLDGIANIGVSINLTMQEVNIKYLIKYKQQFNYMLGRINIEFLVIAFQSGNSRVLKLMNRGYSREELISLLDLLHSYDVKMRFHAIVGFPTETLEEYKDTIDAIIYGGFMSGSLFKYEDRKYAKSSQLFPKVSASEIDRRLRYAIDVFHCNGYECIEKIDKLMVSKIA